MIKAKVDKICSCVDDILALNTTESMASDGVDKLSDFLGMKSGKYLESSKDVAMDIELALRSYLANNLLTKTSTEKLDGIEKLLILSINFALVCARISPSLMNICKTPYLLIEDVLESETIRSIDGTEGGGQSFWYLLENKFIDSLTKPELFGKGKLIILRACNALLRRLSKTGDTELCGRVLMFLAALYPLSEKSAMNLSGNVNTASCTRFESLSEFQQTQSQPQNQGEGEGGSTEAEEQAAPSDAVNRHGIQYSTYRDFWGLQNCLYADPKAVSAPGGSVGVAGDSQWLTSFLKHAETVCTCFEQKRFSRAEIYTDTCSLQHRIRGALEANAGEATTLVAAEAGSNGNKYLASSQLFHLQLGDVGFRLQICTQMLVYLYNIKIRRLAADGLDLRGYYDFQLPASASLSEATTTIVASGVDADAITTVQALRTVECRVFNILENCTGNGRAYARLLFDTLARHEKLWIQWKLGACPNNERVATADAPAVSKKRNVGEIVEECVRCVKNRDYAFEHLHSSVDIIEIANSLVKRVPSFDELIERYRDAEDPDAGIDEEYHPKHDHVYCWRARRLMVARGHRLDLMRHMADGNISAAIAVLYPELAAALAAIRAERERAEEEERERTAAMDVVDDERECTHPLADTLAECVEDEDEEEREREAVLNADDDERECTHPLADTLAECVEDEDEEEREREAVLNADDNERECTHPLQDFTESIPSP